MIDSLSAQLEKAAQAGQSHVVQAAEQLDDAGRATLAASLGAVPWDTLDELRNLVLRDAAAGPSVADMRPPLSLGAADAQARVEQGEALLARGAIAVFTLAGGQGSRLGWNGPKGTFPATAITGKPLFGVLAERIRAMTVRYGAPVCWYIMTSVDNHEATLSFFNDNQFFGLDRANVMLFRQGMLPAFDAATGNLLLGGPDCLAMSPDGHGGSFAALRNSGAIEHMERRGVEQASYVQIDNPLIRAVDPGFIGLHVDAGVSSGEFSSKIIARAHATEKVGIYVDTPSGMRAVEYSDLDVQQAAATDADGRLIWRAANLAMHMVSVPFMRRIAEGGADALPWHKASKKVPFWCVDSARMIEPETNNAIKLERLVFDALPSVERSLLLEVERADEFAPIKNVDGEDSPATSIALQSSLHASWLREASVNVADGAAIEISPLVAQWPGDLDRSMLPDAIDGSEPFVLDGN